MKFAATIDADTRQITKTVSLRNENAAILNPSFSVSPVGRSLAMLTHRIPPKRFDLAASATIVSDSCDAPGIFPPVSYTVGLFE